VKTLLTIFGHHGARGWSRRASTVGAAAGTRRDGAIMIFHPREATEEALSGELDNIAAILKVAALDQARAFPRFVQIETIRECDARCPFCANGVMDKSTPLMSEALFDKITGELADHAHWVRWVNLQKGGEPLLDPRICARIRALKAVGIGHVILATNASRLDREMALALLEAGLDEIMISIDAVDEAEYERLKVGLSFDQVLRNIRGFFAVREAFKPEAIVRMRGVSLHDADSAAGRAAIRRWQDFWAPYRRPQDRVHMQRANNWGHQHQWEGRLSAYRDVYHPCVMPWSTIQITAMGKVALCPQDFNALMDLGDINRQSIAEVWRGGAYDALRRLHATGKRNEVGFCRGCVLYDREVSLEARLATPEADAASAGGGGRSQ